MLTVTCTKRSKDKNNKIIGYTLQDSKGDARDISPDELKKAIKSNNMQVTNVKLTSDNRLVLGKTEHSNVNHIGKYQALANFESKQALLQSRIFDFEADKNTGEISITKYYDTPDRKVVIIPNFVDKFKELADNSKKHGIFSNCKYLEKVIMHSNVRGSLKRLFREFSGPRLDLSDFDTCNINNMDEMFYSMKTTSLDLGNKFDTSKVTSMACMFYLYIPRFLKLGNKFDTSKVKNMDYLFYACCARSINLGNKFDTSRVKSMKGMFGDSKFQSISLGNNFDTSSVTDMSCMFHDCYAKSIDLGDKFDTSNVTDMRLMFYGSAVKQLDLRDKFYTRNVIDMGGMFCACKAQQIILGDKFDTSNVTDMSRMFNECKAKQIDLRDKFDTSSAKDVNYMFRECKATQILVGKHVSQLTLERLGHRTRLPITIKA